MTHFEQAFAEVVGFEKGYVNNPHDPGGETKYGISKRSYPHLDIKNLSLADAQKIYRTDFWDLCYCDEFGLPIALLVFDVAVNSGSRAAGLDLQRSLVRMGAKIKVDGFIGPNTVREAKAIQQNVSRGLCCWLLAHRGQRFGNIAITNRANWNEHSLGWMQRLAMLSNFVFAREEH